MDAIKREMRKIRKNIRQQAKAAGLSADEYRQQNGYTTDWIRQQAQDQAGQVDTRTRKTKSSASRYKPYDGVSNKPLYPALAFGKPTVRIAHSVMNNWDWVVRLSENGSYLPVKKVFRSQSGEARGLNEKPAA